MQGSSVGLDVPAAAAEPAGEPVPQAETAGRQAFLVGCADCAAFLDICRVHVGREGCYQGVEYVGGEGDEWRQRGIRVWEGDVEA